MANVRYKGEQSKHLINNARRQKYVARVEPLNYPNTAVICSTIGCHKPGLVHLNEEGWQDYEEGKEYFYPYRTHEVKIRVGKNTEIIERQNETISFRSWKGRQIE